MKRNSQKRISIAMAAIILTAVISSPMVVFAADLRAERTGVLSVSETVNNDLYAGGSNVTVNAPVMGDAFVAAGNAFIRGEVTESVLAVGGTVGVSGNVADDVRVAGGNIFVDGAVGHDLVVLGGQISVASSAKIGRDLIILGGQININSPVGGNVIVRGGDVTINAPIAGSVDIKAQSVAFGPNASIGGKLAYSSPTETVTPTLVSGGVEYTKTKAKTNGSRGGLMETLGWGLVFKLIGVFLLALVAFLLFKRRTRTAVQETMGKFGTNLLYGLGTVVMIPIAVIILLVTIIGAPVALMVMAVGLVGVMLAGILAPIVLGGWIWKLFAKNERYEVNPYVVLIGAAAYVIAGLIPLIGWAFCLAFFLAALGMVSLSVMRSVKAAASEKP